MLRFKGKKRAVAAATARLAGSTKFGRPQKRERFWGARTSPTRGALSEMPPAGAGLPWPALSKLNSMFFYYNFKKTLTRTLDLYTS